MKKIFFITITLTLTLFAAAQSGNRNFIGDSLDNYITRGMEQWNIPGMQVLVVHDGEVAYMKSFGVKEKGTDNKVDNNTLFMIGSNTKAFTGLALAMLEEKGKWKLNDPVRKHYPEFKVKDEWVSNHMNLTDIITHRMGMMTFQGDFMYWGSDLSRDECIEKFGMLEPTYEFRTRFGYTNLGYAIADKCIENVDGRDWASFVREEILQPLRMENSFLQSSELSEKSNISAAHSWMKGKISVIPWVHNDNIGASASIWSSVSEMKNWLSMQLNNGVFEGEEFVPENVIKRTRQPQTIVGAYPHMFNKRNFMLYGLGWFLEDYESRKVVSHTGGVDGFVSAVTLVPEEKLGIVILTNTDQNSLYSTLNREIMDAYLGLPFRNYDSLARVRAERSQKREIARIQALKDSVNTFNGAINKDISGQYVHDVYGSINIKQRDKQSLLIRFEHHPDLECILYPIAENRFMADYQNPTYGIRVFQFEKINDRWRFILSVNDFLEYTTYTFVKDKEKQ